MVGAEDVADVADIPAAADVATSTDAVDCARRGAGIIAYSWSRFSTKYLVVFNLFLWSRRSQRRNCSTEVLISRKNETETRTGHIIKCEMLSE